METTTENWLISLNCPQYIINLIVSRGFGGINGFKNLKCISSGTLIDIINYHPLGEEKDCSSKWVIIEAHSKLQKDILKSDEPRIMDD